MLCASRRESHSKRRKMESVENLMQRPICKVFMWDLHNGFIQVLVSMIVVPKLK